MSRRAGNLGSISSRQLVHSQNEISAEKLDEPRVLERMLRIAARVELTAGARETLMVKVTDPAR